MNTATNVSLLVVGVGGLTSAIELATTSNYIGAAIAAVVGLGAILLYEKLPPSTPTL